MVWNIQWPVWVSSPSSVSSHPFRYPKLPHQLGSTKKAEETSALCKPCKIITKTPLMINAVFCTNPKFISIPNTEKKVNSN